MKIGFSFGRCIRDIVTGVVDINDVMVIIARTKMPNDSEIHKVCEAYMSGPFYGLDLSACTDVAFELYNSGKIHQPRLTGSFRMSVSDDYVWMDLMPTVNDMTPSVKAAWEQYRMLITLCSEIPLPDDDYSEPTN